MFYPNTRCTLTNLQLNSLNRQEQHYCNQLMRINRLLTLDGLNRSLIVSLYISMKEHLRVNSVPSLSREIDSNIWLDKEGISIGIGIGISISTTFVKELS